MSKAKKPKPELTAHQLRWLERIRECGGMIQTRSDDGEEYSLVNGAHVNITNADFRRSMTRAPAILACIIAAAGMLAAVYAFAHGNAQWIADGGYRDARGALCCGKEDCGIAMPGEIVRIDGGWKHIPTGSVLMDGDKGIHMSRDAQMWRCVPPWLGKMNCLFISVGI